MSTGTLCFPVTGSDLTQFLKTSRLQCFASKLLSINNIDFQAYIYPNGSDKKNVGYVQFVVTPNKFDSHIKSVTVCCKLYCPAFRIMFKEAITLSKESDAVQWSQYALKFSECKDIIDIIAHTKQNHLFFVCEIEILKITPKSDNSSILSIRKKHSSSFDNIFQPPKVPIKTITLIEWHIADVMDELSKHRGKGKSFYSHDINKMWCLCVYSNGNHFELALKLLYLPPQIKTIVVDFSIQQNKSVKYLAKRRNVLFNSKKTQETVTLLALFKFLTYSSLLKISVDIKKMFIFGASGMGKEVTGSFSKYGFDHDEFRSAAEPFHIYGFDNGKKSKYREAESSITASITDFTEPVSRSTTSTTLNSIPTFHSVSSYNVSSLSPPSAAISEPLIRNNTLPNDVPRKPCYPGNSLLPLPTSSRNISQSITAFSNDQSIPLMHISEHKEDKQYQLEIKRWSDPKIDEMDIKSEHHDNMFIIKTNNNTLNELDVQCYDSEQKDNTAVNTQNIASDNIFFIKFKQWLDDDVQLPEYLSLFIESGSADIKLVKSFDDQTLMNIGINNIAHRRHIIDEGKSFKQGQDNFEELIKKHDALKSFRKNFRKNAILTDDDLLNMSKPELQKVLSVEPGDAKVNELWNVIHQTQSPVLPKQVQVNQLKEQYKVMKTAMDEWLTQLLKMHNEANDEKEDDSIRQQVDTILHKYWSRLINDRTILEQLMTDSEVVSLCSSYASYNYSDIDEHNQNDIITAPLSTVQSSIALYNNFANQITSMNSSDNTSIIQSNVLHIVEHDANDIATAPLSSVQKFAIGTDMSSISSDEEYSYSHIDDHIIDSNIWCNAETNSNHSMLDKQVMSDIQETFNEEMHTIQAIFNSEVNERNIENDPNRNIVKCTTSPSNNQSKSLPNGGTNNHESTGNSNGSSNNNDNDESANDSNNNGSNDEDEKKNNDANEKTDDGKHTVCRNKICTSIISHLKQINQKQTETIGQLQRRNKSCSEYIHKQKQWITTLRNSHKSLLTSLRIRIEKNINGNKPKNKRKNKKKQIKSSQKQLFFDIENAPCYQPSPYTRAQGNVFISRKMSQTIVPAKMNENKMNWYKYMDKNLAMQFNDYPKSIDNNTIALNFDFYDEKNQEAYYCIIKKHSQEENKNLKYKMIDGLFTKKEVMDYMMEIEKDTIIHKSSRQKLKPQLKGKHDVEVLLNTMYESIINIKWFTVSIFRRKDKMSNKQRIVLCLENEYMKKLMRDLKQSMKNKLLIPIIMFNNSSHWIEWVLIVRIVDNIDIAISFIYNQYDKTLKVSGIHVDKALLLEQHMLVSPNHDCNCFDNWTSHITDIDICGDLNETENKMKDYKQKYESLKGFVYEFIHTNDYKSLKQPACFLIDHQCQSTFGCSSPSMEYTTWTPQSTTSTSMFGSYSNMSHASLSNSNTNSAVWM